jgi:hypothetical protein
MDYRARMIKNEQLIRDRNSNAAKAIKDYFGSSRDLNESVLEFACECSDLSCKEQVSLSIEEYEKTHRRNDRFVLSKGHEMPAVENVTEQKKSFEVVEKPRLAQ